MKSEREAIQEEEANKIGNQWLGTVALIRDRKLRVLNILGDLGQNKTKDRIALGLLEIYTFLERKAKFNEMVRENIRSVYTEFTPEKHYAKVRTRADGKVIARTPITISKVPRDLRRPRHMWHNCWLHEKAVLKWIDSFDTYLDALYTLTGTALVTAMRDFSKSYQNFVADPSFAGEAAQALPNV